MNKLELTALNCASCGASVSDFQGKDEINCEYCGTNNKILRPKPVTTSQGNLSQDNFDKLNNLVEILQKAIRAGNYNEGYDYCNKALEIDPSIGALWENKAICAFWRSINFLYEDKITNTNAREIKTFLQASRENDPNSETYAETADNIGYNLFLASSIKFSAIGPDTTENINDTTFKKYSKDACIRIKDFIETMGTSFELMANPDYDLLKQIVEILTNKKHIILQDYNFETKKWENNAISKEGNLDATKKREILINLIKKAEPDYQAPEFIVPNSGKVFGMIALGICIVCGILIFYKIISSF
jgi:DNA-directed RNA polymerase subunit RPC12/RpoP